MPFGLSNFGSPLESNICFVNAILQLLYSIAIFRNLVKKKGYKAQPSSVTPVLDELSRIYNYEGPVTSAGPLRQLLGAKEGLSYLMRGEQEDASLFLSHLLEQIFKEVSPDIKLEELFKMSVIHQPCFNTHDGSCSNCRYTPQPREDSRNVLMLQQQQSKTFASLQELLEYYLNDQAIELRCSNDGNCTDADSMMMKQGFMRQVVTEKPEILFVQVPKTVNAKCDEGFFYVQGVRYEVVGVVDHHGPDVNQGHYTAWIKLQSQWWSCDDKLVAKDLKDAHFSSNNYIFVAIRCDSEHKQDKEKCVACKKTFSSLLQHLRQAFNCQIYYDLDGLREEKAARTREKWLQQQKIKRANQSGDEKARVHKEDAKRHAENRKIQSPAKKARVKKEDAERHEQHRKQMSEEQKARVKKEDAERHEQHRKKISEEQKARVKKEDAERHEQHRKKMSKEQKATKKREAAKRMKRKWDTNYAKNNETTTGRKRIFLDLIRDGCTYPCCCCQEAKYSKSVKEIQDMSEFKEALDKKHDNLFNDTIFPCTSVTPDVLKEIPNRKGSYFVCNECKSKLDRGKIPSKSHSNKLEIFDIKNYPDLDLTELELNLISKKIIFMKIHRKPKSQMSAIKDRIVCIPIDSETIEQTLQKLPRLPKEAGLVPIKLKRKQAYKSSHLQEWVDVEKVHRCLLLLKNFGHPEYQFYSPEDFNSYVSRCKVEDKEGYEMLFDPAECEMSIDNDFLENENVEDSENSTDSKEETPKLVDEDEALDEIEYAEKLEVDYRLNDPCAKFQFNYDQTACFINDSPETGVTTHDNNEAISVSPGEGENSKKLSFRF